MALPQELRLKILEHADLITLTCEVEWNPEEKLYLDYSMTKCGGCFFFGISCCHEEFRDCQLLDESSAGCLCRHYHSAFTSSCRCWCLPTPLFLVCKKLRDDAQAVFFSRNRFIIVPPTGCTTPVRSTPARLRMSIFLTDFLPSNAIPLLTSLEIVFPPFYDDYLRPHEYAYQDWLHTIDHMSKLLDLPLLTLRIVMANYVRHDIPSYGTIPDFRTKITKEEGIKIIAMYVRSLSPLSKLREKGLTRFSASSPILLHTLNHGWTFQRLKLIWRNMDELNKLSWEKTVTVRRFVCRDPVDLDFSRVNSGSPWMRLRTL